MPRVRIGPALPDRARSVRWAYYAVRLLLVVMLLGLAAALPGGTRGREKYRYHEGDIARERIVAPYAFRIDKDETTMRRQQELAAASVAPVFVVDARLSSEMYSRFGTFRVVPPFRALVPSSPSSGSPFNLQWAWSSGTVAWRSAGR